MSIRSQYQLSKRKIILLEDNILIGLELEIALQHAGATVLLCSTLEAARTAMDSDKIDFVLSDFFLFEEICRPAIETAIALQIPYAFITGYPAEEVDAQFPGSTIFSKPFPEAEVINHISTTLGPVTLEMHDSAISEETNGRPIADSGTSSLTIE